LLRGAGSRGEKVVTLGTLPALVAVTLKRGKKGAEVRGTKEKKLDREVQ